MPNRTISPAIDLVRRGEPFKTMRLRTYSLLIVSAAAALGAIKPAPMATALDKADNWVVEQLPGGHVRIENGTLLIEDESGCTVWYRTKLSAPVEISYDVTVIARGGPDDRVSDVNCFWMASDPKATDGCPFSPGRRRTGKFAEYDSLQTYYVGMGGNTNTTTRFRRYDGQGAKPLRPEYDLRAPRFLLQPNRTYHLRIVAHDGVAEFWRDDETIFSFTDPAPLRDGWFAFRTVKSHLEIRNFKVQR